MSPPAVAHYLATFLPVTENWIHDQLRYATVKSIVLTRNIRYPSRFPWSPLYATSGSWRQEIGRAIHGFYPLHAEACREHGARLLHAHFGNRALFARRLALHLGIPLVGSFYGRDLAVPSGDVYRKLFADGVRFLAEGPAARERLIELGCPAEKIRIHRLGVNPDEIEFGVRARKAGEPLRVMMAGRFTEKKGFIHGIRAFIEAVRFAPMTLTVIGGAGRNRDEERIARSLRAAARKEESRIVFREVMAREQLLALARHHDIVLQPSVIAADGDREGGHPVILTLLAASGMPAIASRHCDIPEVVEDGVTGWICGERDEPALTAALIEAATSSLEAKSRAARELVLRKYDIRRATLDSAYEGLL